MKTLNTIINFIFSLGLGVCLLVLSLYNLANSQVFALFYLSIVFALALYINRSINTLK